MSNATKELLGAFVAEATDRLADTENGFLSIEAAGEDVDSEVVNRVFRAIHSIKGTAGYLGLATIGALAHEMEGVLNLLRNDQLTPTTAIVDALLRGADALRGLLENVESSNDVDVSECVESLRTAAQQAPDSREDGPDRQFGSELTSQPGFAAPTPKPETAGPARKPETKAAPLTGAVAGRSFRETSLRVSVKQLDTLMSLAGELVLGRNRLLQLVNSSDMEGVKLVAGGLDHVTSELQDAITQTRMQPISTVFSRLPRVVRDLSSKLGKQCQLTLEGETVELDKAIIEAIADPLTHLVRNSIDHGIELPDTREAQGKPAVGRIRLQAFHEAGKVNVCVMDDGAGISTSKLKENAVARGIITRDQTRAMSDRDTLQLIFRAGFSTADRVTDVSGRGVGMDVVKTNIGKLGGTVEVDSQVGTGTTVRVKLPLTLAIIPSLIVRCGGHRFAIPQVNIRELVRIKPGDVGAKIERVREAEVLRLRGRLLPLVRFTTVLQTNGEYFDSLQAEWRRDRRKPTADRRSGDPPDADRGARERALVDRRQSAATGALNIIVVESGQLSYGLVVDGLCDSEEIVVKPLGRHLGGCAYLAGATILGDGRVALILDVCGIAALAQLVPQEAPAPGAEGQTATETGPDSLPVLLFTNARTEQFGVPTASLSRIERIRSSQIDSVGGQEVLQYRGASLPLLSLERCIQASPRQDQEWLHVLVFSVRQREVGLVAPDLIDIRKVPTRIDTMSFREPGVLGSVVVADKTTRLIDVGELAERAHPNWFTEDTVEPTTAGQSTRILLVEDSDFFRQQVAQFLDADGREVISCEDGLIAWHALQDPAQRFDLVVADIEMPNMGGLELTRRIRRDPRLSHLPVIALSSLASEDDMRRGREAGVDEYQIKMDREQVLAAVAKHLSASRAATGDEAATVPPMRGG